MSGHRFFWAIYVFIVVQPAKILYLVSSRLQVFIGFYQFSETNKTEAGPLDSLLKIWIVECSVQ